MLYVLPVIYHLLFIIYLDTYTNYYRPVATSVREGISLCKLQWKSCVPTPDLRIRLNLIIINNYLVTYYKYHNSWKPNQHFRHVFTIVLMLIVSNQIGTGCTVLYILAYSTNIFSNHKIYWKMQSRHWYLVIDLKKYVLY